MSSSERGGGPQPTINAAPIAASRWVPRWSACIIVLLSGLGVGVRCPSTNARSGATPGTPPNASNSPALTSPHLRSRAAAAPGSLLILQDSGRLAAAQLAAEPRRGASAARGAGVESGPLREKAHLRIGRRTPLGLVHRLPARPLHLRPLARRLAADHEVAAAYVRAFGIRRRRGREELRVEDRRAARQVEIDPPVDRVVGEAAEPRHCAVDRQARHELSPRQIFF